MLVGLELSGAQWLWGLESPQRLPGQRASSHTAPEHELIGTHSLLCTWVFKVTCAGCFGKGSHASAHRGSTHVLALPHPPGAHLRPPSVSASPSWVEGAGLRAHCHRPDIVPAGREVQLPTLEGNAQVPSPKHRRTKQPSHRQPLPHRVHSPGAAAEAGPAASQAALPTC